MRAAICPRYGPPEVVHVQEHAAPVAGPGQVGVRVRAAAVNFPDVLLVAGIYQIRVPPPFVPGSEFAGVIDEVGSPDCGFAIGDQVTGTGMYGAFAERVVADTAAVTRRPDGLDAFAAAAGGVAYRTSYHTLRSTARLSAGDELVVRGRRCRAGRSAARCRPGGARHSGGVVTRKTGGCRRLRRRHVDQARRRPASGRAAHRTSGRSRRHRRPGRR